jgi:adenylate kinase
MRLVILGGPGAGKGTQAELLHRRLEVSWIATGDILRTAIAAKDADGDSQTELGRQAQNYVERGELVPDEVMIHFIRQRLLRDDAASGWVLDGYPRTAFQAEELDFLLEDLHQHLDYAIALEAPESVLTRRSLDRGREDDTPEAIQRRIALFLERTTPLLEYYEMRHRLIRINSDQPIDQVQQEILNHLGVG